MKGLVAKIFAASAFAAGLSLTTGCTNQGKCVDPCYPERYVYSARNEVTSAFAPQVQNGHILDQTMWNYHFEAGKDELNNGGRDHLDGLIRRRPRPDARIYLATARDIAYDPANTEKFVEARRELDEKRANAVLKYVQAQTAGRPMQFEIVVHDPMETGEHAAPVNRAVLLNQNSASGSTSVSSSASTAGQGQAGGGNSSSAQGQGNQGGGQGGR
jgi:hypothetical protein